MESGSMTVTVLKSISKFQPYLPYFLTDTSKTSHRRSPHNAGSTIDIGTVTAILYLWV